MAQDCPRIRRTGPGTDVRRTLQSQDYSSVDRRSGLQTSDTRVLVNGAFGRRQDALG